MAERRRAVDQGADIAGQRHFGERDGKAAVGDVVAGGDRAAGDRGADERRRRRARRAGRRAAAGRPRGRAARAARATGRDGRGGRRSATMTSPTSLKAMPTALRPILRSGRRRRSRGWAGSRCRRRRRPWSRCRGETLPLTIGKSSARQASAMPSMQPTNWPMISGRCGLPKLRQSVAASGVAPTAQRLR